MTLRYLLDTNLCIRVLRDRPAGLDLAGDVAVVERALGLERDQRRARIALVAVLDGRLHGAKFGSIHFRGLQWSRCLINWQGLIN